ncbi:MAG: hypothetical protein LWY06_19135 [Firmicutes bacterium]|nr:hypothetical protein [Bacillota bacterium]
MHKISDLHKLLSKENKDLKPDHKYKTAEEGLLRAYYFFRWLDKKEYETTDSVVEAIVKNKLPEQQLEHYCSALVMIDCYETDDQVKKALIYINDEFKKQQGADVLDAIKDARIERRLLKNIYGIYKDSVDRLKNRTVELKSTASSVWKTVAAILVIDLVLIFANVYTNILKAAIPASVMSANPFIGAYGGMILGALLFIIPCVFILSSSKHKLSEHSSKGSSYPEEILKMEQKLIEFKKKLDDKKIKVDDIQPSQQQ